MSGESPTIVYRKVDPKYQLLEPASVQTAILKRDIDTPFMALTPDGVLLVKPLYSWDGPSGPTIDTPSFMRGALFHDVLYQMIGGGFLPMSMRKVADKLLRRLCIEDGMSRIRAWYVYHSVRKFGKKHAKPRPTPKPLVAP